MSEGKDKVAKNDDARANLSAAKRALLEKHLRGDVAGVGGDDATIPRRRGGGAAPLSFAQQRMWFFDQMEPGTSVYNMRKTLRVRGLLDVGALGRSLNEIARRHESLRTTFTNEGGEVSQRVAAQTPVRLETFDLRGLPVHAREGEALRLAHEEALRPFDLSAGPLLRACLFVLGDEDRVLALTMHHIISDGWSINVMMREMTALYEAYVRGAESPLAELPIQYADYAAWQREWLRGERLEAQLSYWKRKLEGAPVVLELPTDGPRPAVQSYNGAQHFFSLPTELSSALAELGRRERATLFMVLLSAWEALLSRYARQNEFLVGTPIANRTRAETEPLIGFLANTLVLRADLRGDPTFRELVGRVRGDCLDAYAHQDVPFEKLVEELRPARDLSRPPLFQVMFLLQNMGSRMSRTVGLSLTPVEVKVEATQFDLTLDMYETSRGLAGAIEYNTDLFDAATVARMAEHFARLLEGVASDPSARVSELPLTGEEERRQLVEGFNRTAHVYEREPCVHEMFEHQAARTPDAVAVEYEGGRVSYRELNERAERIASRLDAEGVGLESRVGVLLERTPEIVAALLGVLKAGAAYVPLDPEYPHERLRFMLEDSGAEVLLTTGELRGRLERHAAEVVLVDEGWDEEGVASHGRAGVSGGNVAYVIYTSGSTGRPKGTLIEHGALSNYISSAAVMFDLKESDRVLQFASISFDAAAEEIFTCLSRGASLVLRTDRMLGTADEFLRACASMSVSVLDLPTAYWHLLVEELHASRAFVPECVRLVIIGGEKARAEQVRRWHETAGPRARLFNTYGPTETTVVATACELRAEGVERARAEASIGRPVANVRAYVLDERLQPVPVGVVGELHVGGAGLARGYLNRPELTAERFTPDPFAPAPGARLYRTGDLVRYRPDGMIEYVGRADNQVKLRGFRIEPGEVESALNRHPAVGACAVVVRERAEGGGADAARRVEQARAPEQRLVAYVVLSGKGARPSAGELRRFVGEALPAYMVPSAFVFVDALPMTPNGKVNRRSLPEPDWGGVVLEDAHVAPRTPVEDILAGIWSGLLGVERVGVNDNFFDLGGHSLLATQVISRTRDAFSLELPLQQLFEHPTVAGLAECVERAMRVGRGPQTPPLARVPREQALPLSFAQQRLWFIEQFEPGSPVSSIPGGLRLEGRLDVSALERALNEMVRRHEVLRTTFGVEGGQPAQVIREHEPFALGLLDLSGEPEEAREAEASRVAHEEARRPFVLAEGPLLRVRLVRLSDDEHLLLYTMHHIVTDQWSAGVMVRELTALYGAYTKGEPSPLAELPLQYADYAAWQREWLRGEELERQLAYWRERLAGAPTTLELPTDRPRPAVSGTRAGRETFTLPPRLCEGLRALSRAEGVTLFGTLLAALEVLLHRYTRQDDIVVGTPIANRTRSEVENLIGFFVNTLVLRARVSGDLSFGELLRRVRDLTLEAYAHQDVPFEKLVEELKPERSLNHSPLFQVMFAFQNAPRATLELPGLKLSPVQVESDATPFDLTLLMAETGQSLSGAFVYNSDLFDGATVRRLVDHFEVLLEGVVADPARRISDLPLLTSRERQRLLREWGGAGKEFPRDESLHELFERQAARTPDAVAVRYEDERLTYRELDARADKLAARLRRLGVGAESRVGVLLERSINLVSALLGVLKAGAAYVPLDPEYPHERLRFMLEDSGAEVLLTTGELRGRLEGHAAKVVLVDEESGGDEEGVASHGRAGVSGGNLAYVIYTSGSTGRPKGTLVEHGNVVRLMKATREWFNFDERDVWTLFHSYAFDFSVWEMWGALLHGGRLVVVPYEISRSPRAFFELLCDEGVTVLNQTPSAFRQLSDAALSYGGGKEHSLRAVILGGEALELRSLVPWFERHGEERPRLVNMYGITETTVHVTYRPLTLKDAREASGSLIGRPIPDLSLYVLDANLEPTPSGVAGELHVGGAGLARGYLNRPGLTAERFIPNPFAERGGERLYRTGDVGRFLREGEVEYLGRADQQVKVRGFRIELGEVEAAIRSHEVVRDCCVVPRVEAGGGRRLVAYVVGEGGRPVGAAELRESLRASLPEYMIPSAFVTLDALPLTANGKLDREALPEPGQERDDTAFGEFVAPSTAFEEVVAGIWSEVLGVEQVGVNDNFFDLGGHSLLAMQLLARVREVLGVELRLRNFFEAPTVAEWAREIERKMSEDAGGDFLAEVLSEIQELSPEQIRSELDAAGRADGKADANG
jgi:amino acid adenylation domain-containing protein